MVRLAIGVLAVYALFHGVATLTGSTLGQWGVPIALLVIGATALASIALPLSTETTRAERLRALGLGVGTSARAIAIASGLGAVMLAFYPIAGAIMSAPIGLRERWWTYVPGLFAQGGVAEEVLFRGYLFGQLRAGRSFRDAALASLPAFALAHVALFATLEPPLAIAALALSVSSAFPLARLYDLGGRSIWAPAILHFVIQAAPKLAVSEGRALELGVGWMAVAIVVPWLVFAARAQPERLTPR